LAALLHGTPVLGISQTLRRETEGTTYIQQGGHHVVHRPTFLVIIIMCTNVFEDKCHVTFHRHLTLFGHLSNNVKAAE